MTCMKSTEVTRLNAMTWSREKENECEGSPDLRIVFVFNLICAASFSQLYVSVLDIKPAPPSKSVALKITIM